MTKREIITLMLSANRKAVKYLIIFIGVLFSASLIAWWIIFTSNQLSDLYKADVIQAAKLASYERMLFWEGFSLLLVVLLAGGALSYFVVHQSRINERFRLFFLTFAHELKTPLTSLRLQTESLAEDLKESPHSTLLNRLIADTTRLSVQLENSLLVASLENPDFFIGKISLKDVLERVQHDWPQLKVNLANDCTVNADRGALELVFRNLIQNSSYHGKADTISIEPKAVGAEVELLIGDNGIGFKGDILKLGQSPLVHRISSRNGLGLYLVRKLIEKMRGTFKVLESEEGFRVILRLRGELR